MTQERRSRTIPAISLPALLSKALIGITLEFDDRLLERAGSLGVDRKPPSLSMWLDLLRFVEDGGVEVRKLPALSGISRPAINVMVACLVRHGWLLVDLTGSERRTKLVRLTPRGRTLAKVWHSLLEDVERRWAQRFGRAEVIALRKTLETIAGQLDDSIPSYPMTLPNRGGTPTGL